MTNKLSMAAKYLKLLIDTTTVIENVVRAN